MTNGQSDRMNHLFNLYNQLGAGPMNLSLGLIEGLRERASTERVFHVVVPDDGPYARLEPSPGLNLIRLPRWQSVWMKMAYRLYLEYVTLPRLVRRAKVDSVLAFGNFLLAPVKTRKCVLLHHPYLFDDDLLARLPASARGVERIKRLAFRLTLRNVDRVVVQSEYVRDRFRAKWPGFRGEVQVLGNPVSGRLRRPGRVEAEALVARRTEARDVFTLLYVSRFYPHKNHVFLLSLSQALERKGVRHRILVTLDARVEGASELLERVAASGLPIENLGELDQAALRARYEAAHALIFPSRSETFGNPLVEAMCFGLPVIAPDLEYARTVLGEAGIHYAEDAVAECADAVARLARDEAHYRAASRRSLERSAAFPDPAEWVERYLALL